MLDAKDEDQIREWNKTVPESIEGCVHDLISTIALQHPDAQAVHAWDGDFTYPQLEALAQKLAYRLTELGTTPQSIVPLYLEKTKWTPVAMLAIIKTGSAAIALDASHPLERLKSIVQQANPKIIISSRANADNASLLCKANILILDEELFADTQVPHDLPIVSPSDIVYISFTSGVRCSKYHIHKTGADIV